MHDCSAGGWGQEGRFKMRKIVQIATLATRDGLGHKLFALCDDGTVWSGTEGSNAWKKMANIPQDQDDVYQVPNVRI